MHIDAHGLVAALKEAPEAQRISCQEVSGYVMEHIFMPLRRGEPVRFADLDFEAFTDEDRTGFPYAQRSRNSIPKSNHRLTDIVYPKAAHTKINRKALLTLIKRQHIIKKRF